MEHVDHSSTETCTYGLLPLINSEISCSVVTSNGSSTLETLVSTGTSDPLCNSDVLNNKDQKLVCDVSQSGASKQILINDEIPSVKQLSSERKRCHSISSADLAESERTEKIQKTNTDKFECIDNNAIFSKQPVCKSVPCKEQQLREKNKFIVGNYNAYYGYRNTDNPDLGDIRMQYLPFELFRGRTILDIGCNIGHVTLCIARDYCPKMITGIDIDGRLISIAKKNVRHYVSNVSESVTKDCVRNAVDISKQEECEKKFKISERSQCIEAKGDDSNADSASAEKEKGLTLSKMISNESILSDPIQNRKCKNAFTDMSVFPHNVMFQTLNYVPETELVVERQRPEYDVILALSVSKWIHLNHGDVGLKLAFRRMYSQLRMGGTLILEAQPWSSYDKKKKLTPDIYRVYQSIKFWPDQFKDYLLSDEVGFTSHKIIGVPFNKSKGFRRSIEMFIK